MLKKSSRVDHGRTVDEPGGMASAELYIVSVEPAGHANGTTDVDMKPGAPWMMAVFCWSGALWIPVTSAVLALRDFSRRLRASADRPSALAQLHWVPISRQLGQAFGGLPKHLTLRARHCRSAREVAETSS